MLLFVGPTPAIARVMEFDRLSLDGVNRAARTTSVAAGKAINAARAAVLVGAENVFASGFAGGLTGDELMTGVTACGIRPQLTRVSAPTRVCVTVIDQVTHTATELVEESHPVESEDYERLLADISAIIRSEKSGTLNLCGSLTPGGPTDFYAKCVRLGKAAQWQTIIDATGEPLRLAIGEHPDWIKPNSQELAKAMGFNPADESALLAHARLLAEAGTNSLITRGAQPALLSAAGESYWFTVPAVTAVSPIGSGDSVTGVLAASLSAGKSPIESTTAALAAGVANVLTPLPAMFELTEFRIFGRMITRQRC